MEGLESFWLKMYVGRSFGGEAVPYFDVGNPRLYGEALFLSGVWLVAIAGLFAIVGLLLLMGSVCCCGRRYSLANASKAILWVPALCVVVVACGVTGAGLLWEEIDALWAQVNMTAVVVEAYNNASGALLEKIDVINPRIASSAPIPSVRQTLASAASVAYSAQEISAGVAWGAKVGVCVLIGLLLMWCIALALRSTCMVSKHRHVRKSCWSGAFLCIMGLFVLLSSVLVVGCIFVSDTCVNNGVTTTQGANDESILLYYVTCIGESPWAPVVALIENEVEHDPDPIKRLAAVDALAIINGKLLCNSSLVLTGRDNNPLNAHLLWKSDMGFLCGFFLRRTSWVIWLLWTATIMVVLSMLALHCSLGAAHHEAAGAHPTKEYQQLLVVTSTETAHPHDDFR